MASTDVRSARTRLESTRRPDFRTETGEQYETADFGDTAVEPQWLAEEHADPPPRWDGLRLDPGRRGMAALVAVAAVIAVVGAFLAWSDSSTSAPVPPLPAVETLSGAAVPETVSAVVDVDVVVSVVGLVRTPSLVTLPPGSRIADAIAAAGGVVDGADTISLNLAQRVSDGDQIVVSPPGLPPAAVAAAAPVGGAAAPESGQSMSLNSATEAQLDDLPGVGPVTAASIVAWRTENGAFTSIDQLGEVDGIGPVRLEKLREMVTL